MQRRSFIYLGVGTWLATLAACNSSTQPPSSPLNTTQSTPKIVIGQATVASALPLFCAVEQGFFKAAGLNVELQEVASAQPTVEGMVAGRIQGSSNGTASASLAVAAIASPRLFQIIAANATNQTFVLDEIIVAQDSPIQTLQNLDGQKVGCGLGPQNLAITKALLAKNGATASQIVPMDISQHPAAVAAGQVAAAYTLEPSGTIGQHKKLTRTLETGVVAKYILGNPQAPWFGGLATLTTAFLEQFPEQAKQYVAAYRQGIEFVRQQPEKARQYLVGYTPISAELASAVPLVDYRLYDEFTSDDLSYFQKYFDFLQTEKVLKQKVDAASLIYRA